MVRSCSPTKPEARKRKTGVGPVQLTIPTYLLISNNTINIYQIRNYVNIKCLIISNNITFFQDFGNKFSNKFFSNEAWPSGFRSLRGLLRKAREPPVPAFAFALYVIEMFFIKGFVVAVV